MGRSMEKELCYFQVEISTKETFNMGNDMEEENNGIQWTPIKAVTKENGKMEGHMEQERLQTPMEPRTSENGNMGDNMEKVK